MLTIDKPLDVWLKFDNETEDEPTYEANTYRNEDGTYRVEYYHTAVGQVLTITFYTRKAATSWLEDSGFIDFSS